MFGSLDPAKLLVILVIVLVVIGPERLPRTARQLGAWLRRLSQLREQVNEEVRSALPDLGLDELDLPRLPRNPSQAVSGFLRDLTSGAEAPATGDGARRNGARSAGAVEGSLVGASGARLRSLLPGEALPEGGCLVVSEPQRGELAVSFDDPAMN